MLFSLLKHYLDTDTALKVSQSVYCFTTSISHGVENYFRRLWGTGISDAIFVFCRNQKVLPQQVEETQMEKNKEKLFRNMTASIYIENTI